MAHIPHLIIFDQLSTTYTLFLYFEISLESNIYRSSNERVSPCSANTRISQQTQNIGITFMQRRLNVVDVGPTLYKCHTK